MRRVMKTVIGTAMAVLLTTSGYARDIPNADYGKGLLETCIDTDRQNKMWCLAFIVAVAQIMRSDDVSKNVACLPPVVDRRYLVAAAVQWMVEHPDFGQYPASWVVSLALATTWPCE